MPDEPETKPETATQPEPVVIIICGGYRDGDPADPYADVMAGVGGFRFGDGTRV